MLLSVILIALCIDGLYGMGHFMAYGIALISSYFIFKVYIYRYHKIIITSILCVVFMWHGVIKYSIWRGIHGYESGEYRSSIDNLERAISLYLNPIGKFHTMLGVMYHELGEIDKSIEHALKAKEINPEHQSTRQLINLINHPELFQE